MSEWFASLQGLYARAWDTLAAGAADADHPARLITLASTSVTGWPEARTVALRRADRQTATCEVHTDLYSDKITSLRKTPRVALLLWDAGQDMQIRLQAETRIQSGESTRDLWDRIPDHGRQSYGVAPRPGAPIAHALDYEKRPNPATFAVLTCRVMSMDIVHLGRQHRRAAYSRSGDWEGQWLSP